MAVSRKPQLRDPRTGKWIKATAAAVRKVAREIGKEYRKAVSKRNEWAQKRYRGAKQKATLKRYDREYRKAAKKAAHLAPKLVRAQEQVSAVEAKRARLPKVIEIGVDYGAAKGASSDVNFNIRVARRDGRGVSEADAMRAVVALAQGDAQVPSDLRITTVDWYSPSRVKRGRMRGKVDQDAMHAWAFHPILAEVVFNRKGEGLRLGHVKDDVL